MTSPKTIRKLEKIALQLRFDLLEMIGVGKAGHLGGSSSLAEIAASLYFEKMRFDPRNVKDPNRDRFILSKGHAVLIQYAALTELGVIPREELKKVKTLTGVLQGHPDMINATFDNLLTNISEQKQAGKLWNPTVSQYIDYWIAAKNVDVKCTGINTYTVVNHNSGTVNGFSMRVTGSYTPKLDGGTLSTKTNGADTIFWMNLPTGMHTITLES